MSMPLAANCRKTFYPALHTSGHRSTSDVHWIVLHDEEADSARSAASYFQDPKAGGSAHLCVDAKECYRTLANDVIPWGAASSFGANTHGIHIEQAGFAKWSAVVWRSHLGTLKRAAYKTAEHCVLFHIPPVFVDANGLLAGKRGVTTHAEVSKASVRQDPHGAPEYSHSDPGPFWPRSTFMWLVRRYHKKLSA